MGQDTSAQETEGLTLTDVSFGQKQLLYFLDNTVRNGMKLIEL